jgi:hypothetical protein
MALNYTGLTPFPGQYRAKLRFSDISTVASDGTTGTLCGTQRLYQLNSLFEPHDGTARQPYGFDQMAALYSRYKVTAVNILLTGLPIVLTGDCVFLHLLIQNPDGARSLTGVLGSSVEEFPNGASIPVTSVAATWQQKFQMHTLSNISKREYDANVEDYSAAVGANPARMPTLSIAASALGTSDACLFHLVIEYECVFFGRVGQAVS